MKVNLKSLQNILLLSDIQPKIMKHTQGKTKTKTKK